MKQVTLVVALVSMILGFTVDATAKPLGPSHTSSQNASANHPSAAAGDKSNQQAGQSAAPVSDEQKRRDAAEQLKNKELAALERERAQAAWEARCQIKPVMTDEEIDTCREVWSKPPR